MKVNILSLQNVDNYGSVLQAYALKKMIEAQGCEVSFLTSRINPEEFERFAVYYKTIRENNLAVHGLRRYLTIDKDFFHRILHRAIEALNFEKKMFRDFRREALNISDVNVPDNSCDLCVIGSDEVFNFQNKNYGYISQFFGNIPNANRVISYAASCGHAEISAISKEYRGELEKQMKRFDAISVRDENTMRFVEMLTGNSPLFHFDPAIIYSFKKEMEQSRTPAGLPKRYCLVYAYGNRINRKDEIEAIRAFCKKNKLIPVSLGGAQDWIGKHFVVPPFQALKIFAGATFVVTDTFHGTIFSYKYSKRFAVLIRESNRNKLSDLVKRLAIQDHVITRMDEIEDVYKRKNDTQYNAERIEQWKQNSINYLREFTK